MSLVSTIDLVLLNQQSVRKTSFHLMDTVNAKKRWTTIYWRVTIFDREPHSGPPSKWASIIFEHERH
jgi:hypothetical protein